MFNLHRLVLLTLVFSSISLANASDLKEVGQDITDSVITTKITAKYTKNTKLNPLKIMVSTKDGVVTLTGHVYNKEAFVDALRLAKTTKGVTSVQSKRLEIKQVNTSLTDAYITAKVEAAVLEAKVLDDESIPLVGINAKTINGIVTLSGDVQSNASITAILRRVNAIKGVKKIISELQVNTTKQA